MAEDVEITSGVTEEQSNEADNVEVLSPQHEPNASSNDISSTESSDCIIDVVSTDGQASDLVSSASSVHEPDPPLDVVYVGSQACDCSSQSVDQGTSPSGSLLQQRGKAGRAPNDEHGSSHVVPKSASGRFKASSSCEYVNKSSEQRVPWCSSDCECDIIVDDEPVIDKTSSMAVLPLTADHSNGGIRNSKLHNKDDITSSLRPAGRRSRSVTPSPTLSRNGFSMGGGHRQRSGSLSGTVCATPSPRPISRGTPGERQRSGSMGEIDMRERNAVGSVTDIKPGVRIIDDLDILQLPRPRNPGGVLPQESGVIENEAIDLIMNKKTKGKRKSSGEFASHILPSSFSDFQSSDAISTTAAIGTSANTSYLISNIIRTEPNTVSKPFSSHTMSLSSSYDSHIGGGLRRWSSSINEAVERPQPSSVVDSEGVAKKIARLDNQGTLCSSSVESLWTGQLNSQPETQQFRNMRAVVDRTPPERPKPPRRRLSPFPDNSGIDISGDRFISPSRRRRSPVSSGISHLHNSMHFDLPTQGTYRQLRCHLCDYTTNEKVSFRRHRRLHHKNSPVNVFRCGKCSFSTILPRKIREHYHQVHHDIGTPGMISELTDNHLYATQRFTGVGSRGPMPVDGFDSYGGYINSSNMSTMFPYSSSGRQPTCNYPLDQYNVPYATDVQDRREEQIASNYLRSIVTSIVNSDINSRHTPSSTITSSSYFLPRGSEQSQPEHNLEVCTTHGRCSNSSCTLDHSEVKVKVEPDVDVASDVSSTATLGNAATPEVTRSLTDSHSHSFHDANCHLTSTPFTNGNADSSFDVHRPSHRHKSLDNRGTAHAHNDVSDIPTDLTSSRKNRSLSAAAVTHVTEITSNVELENGNDVHINSVNAATAMSSTIVKSDRTTRGVQCVLPLIKTELDLDGDYYDYYDGHRFRFRGVDRAVQCNIFSPTNGTSKSHVPREDSQTQSVCESELSEQHSLSGELRCDHCGIVFEDEVIFSIHIGCHSHTDPFKCNVCGKRCGTKYGFYSHIMRGHQY